MGKRWFWIKYSIPSLRVPEPVGFCEVVKLDDNEVYASDGSVEGDKKDSLVHICQGGS